MKEEKKRAEVLLYAFYLTFNRKKYWTIEDPKFTCFLFDSQTTINAMDRFPIDNPWINFPQLSGASAIIVRRINNADRRMYQPLSIHDLRGVRIERRRLATVPLPCPATRYSRHHVIYWPDLYCGPYLRFAMLAVYEGNIAWSEIKRPIKSSKASIAWKLIPSEQSCRFHPRVYGNKGTTSFSSEIF